MRTHFQNSRLTNSKPTIYNNCPKGFSTTTSEQRAGLSLGKSKQLLGFAWYSATQLPDTPSNHPQQRDFRKARARFTADVVRKAISGRKNKPKTMNAVAYRILQHVTPHIYMNTGRGSALLENPGIQFPRYNMSDTRSYVYGGPTSTGFRQPTRRVHNKHSMRPADTYFIGMGWRRFRMRWESYLSKQMGVRTYIWFANIWRTMTSLIRSSILNSMHYRVFKRLSSRAFRFFIRDGHSFVMYQSIILAALTVTGLQFFMKLLGRHMTYRSHWAYITNMVRFFDVCKAHFYFKTMYQYRVIVRGKFGGQLRAKQKVFQSGVLRLHQWSLPVNYYRVCPTTKYGTFSIRFWIQIRDLRALRLDNIRKGLASDEDKVIESEDCVTHLGTTVTQT